MSGLLMVGLFITWVFVSVMLSRWFARKFRHPTVRTAIALLSFVVLLVLPLVDELIGMQQFDALCEGGATLKIDADAAKGKTVRLVINPSNEILPGQMLVTYHTHMSFRDVGTNQEIASFSTYVVKGGWLIRALGLFDSSVPLVIGKPWCGPDNEGSLPTRYGFALVN